ncbi:MAG: glycosyltransferase [Acidobacteria bacterium]|nr:glycosyltransferase [Acidobacteriota bacterium]MBV9476148.1 glycosyltransferase [Acidobacteriota bacterium]
MRIAQIILPDASEYERKCQRVDFAALSAKHDVRVVPADAVGDAQVAHVYAGRALPASLFRGFPIPYVAAIDIHRSRWILRKPAAPAYVVSPLTEPPGIGRLQPLPEAVEDAYFVEDAHVRQPRGDVRVVGSFARASTRNLVEQTLARIQRFRADVTWTLFHEPPSPRDLRSVDLWVDPALSDDDLDGFVAEALVSGIVVAAAKTSLNRLRLEQNRTGFLVPLNDPNEMTHAILAALFKPEVAEAKMTAARQTASKFRPRQRLRILAHLYETLIG